MDTSYFWEEFEPKSLHMPPGGAGAGAGGEAGSSLAHPSSPLPLPPPPEQKANSGGLSI